MRKLIFIIFLCSNLLVHAQTHIEYISEKTDTMALINKHDIDIINNVFVERNRLDSLNVLNEKIILQLELESLIKDSIILKQDKTIDNTNIIVEELEKNNLETIEKYSQELKTEKRKKTSFQTLTGVGIITIILLILL